MKIRSGFVSNSSSSSFIIAFKGGSGNTDVMEDLEPLFKLPDSFPLKDLDDALCRTIMRCIDSREKLVTISDFTKWIEEEEFESDKTKEKVLELINKQFTVYFGSFSTENDPIESLLCDSDLNFESDNLYIQHEGRY